MLTTTTNAPLDDVAFLARSEHRVVALEALAERPRTRAELQALAGASSSTVGRTLRRFEERCWVTRVDGSYEATPLGAFVSAGLDALLERVETERELRAIWEWLPADLEDVVIELGAGGVVTNADADEPYRPVNRFVSLLESTERFRFAGRDLALLEPCRDVLRRRILEGMEAEIVDPPSIASYVLETYPEFCRACFESGNLAVSTHDDLPPYGVCLFDDRVALGFHNAANGTVQALIDTDAPAGREWAESVYASYRREARPLAFDVPRP